MYVLRQEKYMSVSWILKAKLPGLPWAATAATGFPPAHCFAQHYRTDSLRRAGASSAGTRRRNGLSVRICQVYSRKEFSYRVLNHGVFLSVLYRDPEHWARTTRKWQVGGACSQGCQAISGQASAAPAHVASLPRLLQMTSEASGVWWALTCHRQKGWATLLP